MIRVNPTQPRKKVLFWPVTKPTLTWRSWPKHSLSKSIYHILLNGYSKLFHNEAIAKTALKLSDK